MMEARSPPEATLPPLMQAGGELSLGAIAALCGHPSFPDAMRAMLADNVRLYRGNRILNYVGYDRGRLLVGILAYYLHASRSPTDPTSGLTAHRLKALCAEQDVCSPGRARAMLSLLQLFGYIAPAPGSDRRYKLLAPTALLTAFLRERWSAMFAAIALLKPEGAAARRARARRFPGGTDARGDRSVSHRRSRHRVHPRARRVRRSHCRRVDPGEPRHCRLARRQHAAEQADPHLDLRAGAALLGLARPRAAAPARGRGGWPDRAKGPGNDHAQAAVGAWAAAG